MDLKTLLGDAYKENMTLDEINEALADKNFVDPSTLPKSVEKSVFDKTASELAKVKKELKALQESSMTDAEKLQAELDKAQEAQTTYARELSKLRAKEIFVEAGLTEKEYSSILDTVVSDDEEVTKTRAKTMIELIANQKKLAEEKLKKELLKDTPTPRDGDGSSTITKEDFKKMGWRERVELKQQNPELFKQLSKED